MAWINVFIIYLRMSLVDTPLSDTDGFGKYIRSELMFSGTESNMEWVLADMNVFFVHCGQSNATTVNDVEIHHCNSSSNGIQMGSGIE